MPQFDAFLNSKTDLGAAPAAGDKIPVIDVSDTSEDAGGTLKTVDASLVGGGATSRACQIWAGQTPVTQTGWSALTVNAAKFYATQLLSSAAQNDSITFEIPGGPLSAGTYTFTLAHFTLSNRGIYTVEVSTDGSAFTSIGTIDGYAASGAQTLSTITGAAITDGTRQVRLTMATKNASSTAYFGDIQALTFLRTA